MFTENQIKDINSVKDSIESFISGMMRKPWWNSNFDNELYLTGGAIASLIQGLSPKDWDFYTKTLSVNNDIKFWLTESVAKNNIADVDEKYKEMLGKMITANAITMDNGASFITMIAGKPDDIRKTFDYVHCMPYYDLATRKLHISKLQFECCKRRLLVTNNENAFKVYRQDKFRQRGYTIHDRKTILASLK